MRDTSLTIRGEFGGTGTKTQAEKALGIGGGLSAQRGREGGFKVITFSPAYLKGRSLPSALRRFCCMAAGGKKGERGGGSKKIYFWAK